MVDRSNRLSPGHLLRVLSMIALSAVLALLAHSPRADARLRGPSPQVATPGDVPRLDIELSGKDFEKLSAELARRGALGGVRGKEDRSQRVKARGTARGDGPRVAVRVELLEEWSERLEGGRWPLFVNVRGDGRLYGIDRFSLRAPAIRGYQAELLMLEHMRREGIVAPRVFFVRASLNGEDLGLMKLDEELGKDMVEAQERRDGAILRFEDGGDEAAGSPGLSRAPDDFLARPLVFERPSRAKKSPAQAADRRLAVDLLAGFLAGSVDAREVFDVDLMARFLAVCELWRAVDSVRWPNLRFYFNPVTKRLEPIAHAASPPALFLEEGLVATSEPWPAALLADSELRAAFERHLHRVAAEALDGQTEAWLREEEAPLQRMLRGEHRTHAALGFEPIAARARRLARSKLGPAPHTGADDGVVLEPVGRPPVRNPVPASTREQTLERHPFLVWNESFDGFEVPPGIHEVGGSLVLPDGAGLRAGPATTLRFGRGEILLARGRLVLIGTADKPVVLEGRIHPDGTRDPWQGIVVLYSERPHMLDHVEVRSTSGVDRDGWQLTGGFTIRSSTLDMRNMRIVGSRAEDALNLIRTRFMLRHVDIVDARSDGIDLDFSSGSLEGGRFGGIGGDAIDMSGAEVTIDGVVIENVRDKAVSVGERSRLVLRNMTIDSVGTGVASKDGSVALVEDSTLRRVTHAALMAYSKKPGYGPAELEARRVELDRIGRPALAQLGSRVVIDGAAQAAEAVDVDALYKSGYMEK
ncbi:MAG: right-handed parallel beta-helix repeat-containing protein [Myxococcota bacterium]|nr:right-handed parallel beta-helix repeat-containing protein [Myxococcota bacterium]